MGRSLEKDPAFLDTGQNQNTQILARVHEIIIFHFSPNQKTMLLSTCSKNSVPPSSAHPCGGSGGTNGPPLPCFHLLSSPYTRLKRLALGWGSLLPSP